jgi:hypothetical protein
MRVNLSVYVLKQYLMEKATLVANSNVKNVVSFSLRKQGKQGKQGINFHQNHHLLLLFQDGLMRSVLLAPVPSTFGILNILPF